MMKVKILFDDCFDGPVWTGRRGSGTARVGETELGFRGFLDFLEGRLGLGGLHEWDGARSASLLKALRERDGFWTASCAVDPFACADTLLSWRDALAMGGWDGTGGGARFEALGKLCDDLAPGMPDRLHDVARALGKSSIDIESVTLLTDRTTFPLAWRNILDALEGSGCSLQRLATPVRAGTNDVDRALKPGFKPSGDDSLILYRPSGTMAAAGQVAAFLAEDFDPGDLIIGADTLLDEALCRYGLPITGARRPDRDPLMDVLPLVLDMGWNPPDPQRVVELLCLPRSPVPRSIAGRLAGALADWPAVGSEAWGNALAEGVDNYKPESKKGEIEKRLALVFEPSGVESRYPAAGIRAKLAVLDTWLRGNWAVSDDSGEKRRWERALEESRRVGRLLDLCGIKDLSRSWLASLLERARKAGAREAARPAEAGIVGLEEPGAVVAPVRRITWWNCTRGSSGTVRELPLTVAERQAFAGMGVEVPDPLREARRRRNAWMRPFAYAETALMLVCPAQDADGGESAPHPVWDEVVANAGGKPSAVAPLVVHDLARFITRKEKVVQREAAPARLDAWELPEGFMVKRREKESPTGAELLVACPFTWFMEHVAHVYPGSSARLPEYTASLGSLAHHVVERALADQGFSSAKTDKEVEDLALAIFEREGPTLVAQLFVPGSEARRAGVRAVIASTTSTLRRMLAVTGTSVRSLEQKASKSALGSTLEGRTDIVIGTPERIIDLKYGGARYKRQDLEAGAALQLALYSWLRGVDGGAMPSAAYYIMTAGQFLSLDAWAFDLSLGVNGPSLEECRHALFDAYERRFEEFAKMDLAAPAVHDPDKKGKKQGILKDGELDLPAPCKFCKYGRLCGRDLEER